MIPDKILSFSPASLPTTRISVPTEKMLALEDDGFRYLEGAHTLCKVGAQFQAIDVHVLDRFGIVTKNSEIVYGIAVDGVAVDFLMVVEDTVAPKGTSTDNMTVG